jgi:anti-sigma factor RsiW
MRCKAVRNKLDRLSRQELAPRERERIEAHLSTCADCRRLLAAQERLASLLTNLPKPPSVPEGFGDRLMAVARERRAARRPVPGSLWRSRWLSPSASVGRKAAQAVALAGGLLIGVLMGQQTWRSAHSSIPQQAVAPDPVAVYELDYLTDAPGGSLAQSYLSLTKAPNHNGT